MTYEEMGNTIANATPVQPIIPLTLTGNMDKAIDILRESEQILNEVVGKLTGNCSPDNGVEACGCGILGKDEFIRQLGMDLRRGLLEINEML